MSLSRFVTASVLFLALGCSMSDSNERSRSPGWVDFSDYSADTTALVGEWDWVRTRCCYGDLDVATPRSTGETQSLTVTHTGTVKVYRNETLHEQTTLREYLRHAQWGVRGDSLAVSWAHIDGPESEYVRSE